MKAHADKFTKYPWYRGVINFGRDQLRPCPSRDSVRRSCTSNCARIEALQDLRKRRTCVNRQFCFIFRIPLLFFAILALTLQFCLCASYAEQFRAEGKVARYFYGKAGEFASVDSPPISKRITYRQFHVSVKSGEWKIRLQDLEGKWDLRYQELASDGEELYHLKKFNYDNYSAPTAKSTSMEPESSASPIPINTANATIEIGGYPKRQYDFDFFVIWTAFASGNWIKRLGDDDIAKQITAAFSFSSSHETKVNTYRIINNESVPIAMLESLSRLSTRMASKLDLSNRALSFDPWPSPFQEGFCDLDYRVLEWTAESESKPRIPSLIKLVEYALLYTDATRTTIVRSEIGQSTISLDAVVLGESHSSFKPEANLPTSVFDRRFDESTNAPNFTYLISNGNWPEKTAPELLGMLDHHNASYLPPVAARNKWPMLLLALLLVPPILFVVIKSIKMKGLL